MRQRTVWLAAVMLLVCSLQAGAQNRIEKIAKELEEKGVECNRVVSRNPNTKRITSTVKSYTFRSKDGVYAKKLEQAFAADAENSTTEVSDKGGREWTLIFDTSEQHMLYTLEVGKGVNPRVELNIIIKPQQNQRRGARLHVPDFGFLDQQSFTDSILRGTERQLRNLDSLINQSARRWQLR